MRKIWFSIFIISLLVIGACSNKDKDANGTKEIPEDDGEETVVFEAFGVKAPAATTDWEHMDFLTELADNVNVEINWTNATPQTASEQVNLMFAGNDLPDMIYSAWTLGGNDLVKYGANGQLLALEDLIEEHAPNIKAFFEERPEVKGMVTAPDGHIYSIPQYDEAPWASSNDAMFINKAWLDEVGKDIPTTTEEFKDVLIAFRDADLNGNGDTDDEIPFSFTVDNEIRGAHSLSGSFGVLGRFTGVENGKVHYAPIEPEYKDYLNYMHELYEEDLIDPEAFTHDVQIYDSKIKNSTPILGSYFSWSTYSDYGSVDTDYVVVPPLEGPNGDKGWNSNGIGTMSQSGFSITAENPNPIRAIKWIDQMFEPEMSVQVSKGPLGVNIKKENGKFITIDPPEGMSYEEFRHKESPASYGAYAILSDMYDNLERTEGEKEKLEYAELYADYQPEEFYPSVVYSEEDADRINTLTTDIDEYIYQKIAQFIIEGNADKEWDAYIKQLDQMGMQELLEIYQKYYDNFIEAQ